MVLCRLLGVGGLGTASAASSVISRLGRSGVAVGSGTLGVDGLLFMRAASMRRVVGLRDARRSPARGDRSGRPSAFAAAASRHARRGVSIRVCCRGVAATRARRACRPARTGQIKVVGLSQVAAMDASRLSDTDHRLVDTTRYRSAPARCSDCATDAELCEQLPTSRDRTRRRLTHPSRRKSPQRLISTAKLRAPTRKPDLAVDARAP